MRPACSAGTRGLVVWMAWVTLLLLVDVASAGRLLLTMSTPQLPRWKLAFHSKVDEAAGDFKYRVESALTVKLRAHFKGSKRVDYTNGPRVLITPDLDLGTWDDHPNSTLRMSLHVPQAPSLEDLLESIRSTYPRRSAAGPCSWRAGTKRSLTQGGVCYYHSQHAQQPVFNRSRRVHFATYGNKDYLVGRERLRRAAINSGLYETVTVFDEVDTARWFAEAPTDTAEVLSQRRGGGYYLWKPFLLKDMLSRVETGDIIFYCDAGSNHDLSDTNLKLLLSSFEAAARSPSGLTSFVTYPSDPFHWTMKEYTKADVYQHFFGDSTAQMMERSDVTHDSAAGRVILRKCVNSEEAVNVWAETAMNTPRLFDDSQSQRPNHRSFVESKHDQSVWSVILHLKGPVELLHACYHKHMPVGRYCKARTQQVYGQWPASNMVVWPCMGSGCVFPVSLKSAAKGTIEGQP
eukprot:TRINITY_DN2751_c0_g1_i1.p1 TRINITY_DN2751_c0_g1~~TRINITY_DN2751_c0_g1_i1.p1  ORF type:complete len:461 (+),score=71.53 TRINITY_DN2751_c0_g1_i1:201-1583(+)